MTVTEFLLARLAEEHDGLGRTYRDLAEAQRYGGQPLMADWLLEQRARVLADVEAKRAVVARAEALAAWDEMGSSTREDGEFILETLALPYADHPDYREEWRP